MSASFQIKTTLTKVELERRVGAKLSVPYQVKDAEDGFSILAPYTFTSGYPRELVIRCAQSEDGILVTGSFRFRNGPRHLLAFVFGCVSLVFVAALAGQVDNKSFDFIPFVFLGGFVLVLALFVRLLKFVGSTNDKQFEDLVRTVIFEADR